MFGNTTQCWSWCITLTFYSVIQHIEKQNPAHFKQWSFEHTANVPKMIFHLNWGSLDLLAKVLKTCMSKRHTYSVYSSLFRCDAQYCSRLGPPGVHWCPDWDSKPLLTLFPPLAVVFLFFLVVFVVLSHQNQHKSTSTNTATLLWR